MTGIVALVEPGDLAAALATPSEPGELRFWWLGQAGFAFRIQDELFLIDPYLSDALAEKYRQAEFKHERLMPVPIAPERIVGCHWCLCTHAHSDHMDPVTMQALQRVSKAHFLVPRAERETAVRRGVHPDRLVEIDAGESQQLTPGTAVTALPSAHEILHRDENGRFACLGYLIDFHGFHCYHSGDCVPYVGLAESLGSLRVDAAFLPINGRDAHRAGRGVPGNFTLEEAVDLCLRARIPRLVCHHFGMFAFNTIPRTLAQQELEALRPDVDWLLPEVGVTYQIQSARKEHKGGS